MTISKEEIKADFERFIRHEAMRANCTQSEIREIIESKQEEPINEDLEEAAYCYVYARRDRDVSRASTQFSAFDAEDAFKAGAKWQGEQKPAENKGMNLVEEEMTPFQKKVFCIIDTTIEEEQGLKQVCDELLRLAHNEIMIKQKPAEWSEYDEKFLLELSQCCDLNKTQVQWLISLKDRIQPQPKQEWGEEDEELLHDVSDTYFYNDEDYPEETYKLMLKRVLDWMTKRAKSLKPQPQWKPTKEQLIALQDARGIVGMYSIIGLILKEVIEELKKLREE